MRATTNEKILQISEDELLHFLFGHAVENGYSIAAWKLPDTEAREIILSKRTSFIERDSLLEELDPGFIFAEFDRAKQMLFLPADLHFTVKGSRLAEAVNPLQQVSINWLGDHLNPAASGDKTNSAYHVRANEPHSTDHTQPYLSIVENGLREIEQGKLEKVVPSRSKAVLLNSAFDHVQAFTRLCEVYPHAFVSVVSSPETSTWMGASPEELVRVIDKTIFKTVALAGTQPYAHGTNLRRVAWTQKEIEEQALVERYIISCFKKIRLREYEEHGPKTVVAGNLMHLRSDFTVNIKETNFPQLGSVMLQLLHPTSAVCGSPLEPALDFLARHEGYDRQYYSGFLGPVQINNSIDIFVNLRCMQLRENSAVLYAGAGVTIDSVAEQEFEETEMKMNTLLSIIQGGSA